MLKSISEEAMRLALTEGSVAAAIEAAIAIQSSWERAMEEPGGEDFARSMVRHWEAIEAHLRTITITA